jgi:hypothetical protein
MTHAIPTAQSDFRSQDSRAKTPKWSTLAWPFLCLLLLELVTFGINVKRVGVYQDEWIYFGYLHFVPHTLVDIVSSLFWDPRIIVRPIEALYYGCLYFLLWEKPLWYHVACYGWELIGCWFLYLFVARLGGSRLTALAAAVLFMLYPNHDSTHYYITASVEQVSASFFTLSLWLFLKGIDERRTGLLLWAGLAYLLSVHFYEQTLPLAVLYPLLSLLCFRSEDRPPSRFGRFVIFQIPFVFVAVSMIWYRSWLLPQLGLGWRYSTNYSLSHFLKVMAAGVNVSISPHVAGFCAALIGDALKAGLPAFSWLCLTAAATAVLFCATQAKDDLPSVRKCWSLILLGVVTLLFAYTIFGISAEHMPVIDSWRNRVNIGGSLGACLILAGLLGLAHDVCGSVAKSLGRALVPSALALLTVALILVDWEFAKYWIVSWNSQKDMMFILRKHADEFKSGDSILIGDITRYARWAPVVDGVWDFQNLVRTTLNDRSLNATVVTERLVAEEDAVIDRTGSLTLATLPYRRLILYSPLKRRWIRVQSRAEFFEQARALGWPIANGETDR